MKKLILLLWPSFLCAVLASLLFYSIFDPYALRPTAAGHAVVPQPA